MYAVRLPAPIPAAGSRGGPPLPSERHSLFVGKHGEDSRVTYMGYFAHPERVLDTGAEIQRQVDSYSAKFVEGMPWLKKRLAEPGP